MVAVFKDYGDWKFPKLHNMKHYGACIFRGGPPLEYNAEMWEKSHQDTVKRAYQMSNMQLSQVDAYIARFSDRERLLSTLAPQPLIARRENQTAMRKVRRNRTSVDLYLIQYLLYPYPL